MVSSLFTYSYGFKRLRLSHGVAFQEVLIGSHHKLHSLILYSYWVMSKKESATDLPPSAKIFTEKLLLLFNREEDPVDLLGSRYRNLRWSRGSVHGSSCSNIAQVGIIRAQLFSLSPFYVSLVMAHQ
jgi:hypothetical protein